MVCLYMSNTHITPLKQLVRKFSRKTDKKDTTFVVKVKCGNTQVCHFNQKSISALIRKH